MVNLSKCLLYSYSYPFNTPEKMLRMLFDLGMSEKNIKNQNMLKVLEHMLAVVDRIMAAQNTDILFPASEIRLAYIIKGESRV
jgi:hypothetical protein